MLNTNYSYQSFSYDYECDTSPYKTGGNNNNDTYI